MGKLWREERWAEGVLGAVRNCSVWWTSAAKRKRLVYVCASQDWDTEGKDRGTVQLTGCGSGRCMCAHQDGGMKDLVIFIAGKGRQITGKMQGRDIRQGIGDLCEKGKRREHYVPR